MKKTNLNAVEELQKWRTQIALKILKSFISGKLPEDTKNSYTRERLCFLAVSQANSLLETMGLNAIKLFEANFVISEKRYQSKVLAMAGDILAGLLIGVEFEESKNDSKRERYSFLARSLAESLMTELHYQKEGDEGHAKAKEKEKEKSFLGKGIELNLNKEGENLSIDKHPIEHSAIQEHKKHRTASIKKVTRASLASIKNLSDSLEEDEEDESFGLKEFNYREENQDD